MVGRRSTPAQVLLAGWPLGPAACSTIGETRNRAKALLSKHQPEPTVKAWVMTGSSSVKREFPTSASLVPFVIVRCATHKVKDKSMSKPLSGVAGFDMRYKPLRCADVRLTRAGS